MESSLLFKLWLNDVGRWLVYLDIHDITGEHETVLSETAICEIQKDTAVALAKEYAFVRRKLGLLPSDVWLVTIKASDKDEVGRSRLTQKDGVW